MLVPLLTCTPVATICSTTDIHIFGLNGFRRDVKRTAGIFRVSFRYNDNLLRDTDCGQIHYSFRVIRGAVGGEHLSCCARQR